MSPNVYTFLIAWWPSSNTDGYPSGQPSPGTPMPIPDSVNPLRPPIVLKFSRALDPLAYATADSWSPYFVLTSLTHPAATNITAFTRPAWNPDNCVLSFAPTVDLVPGDQYLASLNGSLRDSQGRMIERNYSWTFDLPRNTVASTGVPTPTPVAPVTQSVVDSLPALTWGVGPLYTPPSGTTLLFRVSVCSDKGMTDELWNGLVPAL